MKIQPGPWWHQPPLLTHHQYRYRDTLHHSQRHEWHIRILGVLACMVSLSSGGLVAIGVLWYVHLRCRQLSPDDWATEKYKRESIILLKQIKSIITHTHDMCMCVWERDNKIIMHNLYDVYTFKLIHPSPPLRIKFVFLIHMPWSW